MEAAIRFLEELERESPAREYDPATDSLFDLLGLISLEIDGDQTVVDANAPWADSSGTPAVDIVGRPVSELFEPSDWNRHSRVFPEVIERRRRADIEARMLRHDGGTFDVFGRIVPSDLGARLVLFDVTARNRERRRKDEAYRLERVGRLTAGIGHDFGNVFAVMKMNAEMLKLGLSGSGSDLFEVEQVLGATEDGMKLVNNLMAFGRGHSISPIALDPVLLVSLLEEPLSQNLASEIQLEIVLEEGADCGRPVRVDTKALEHMLEELVDNATDALGGEGVIKIEVGAPQVAPDFGVEYTRIGVRDSGRGMPADAVERVFDPFYSDKMVGKGTGLGLPMLRRTMQAHDGHVLVESEVGHGTAVHLFFPVADQPDQ